MRDRLCGAAALLATFLAAAPLAAQEASSVHRAAGFDIAVVGDLRGFALDVGVTRLADGLEVLTMKLATPASRSRSRRSSS